MKWCFILLLSLVVANPGIALAESSEDPEDPTGWIWYCVFIAPDEMPPIAVDLDNCEIPDIPPPIP